MRIHVYAPCWNDRRMLPFFVRHYSTFAERIVVYDDGSTDESLAYLAQFPTVECRTVERTVAGSTIASLQALQNRCWKESRGTADWVIVVAVDEHLYHADLPAYLARCRSGGVTIVPAVGWEMVSASFPDEGCVLWETVRKGVPLDEQHRVAIFDPEAIDEIGFSPGRHRVAPVGRVRYPEIDEVRLLHFKHLGLDYVLERTAQLKTGLQQVDVSKGYGVHWLRDRAAMERDFGRLVRAASEVRLAGPCGIEHWTHRWWRRQWPWHMRCWDRLRYLRAVRRTRRPALAPGHGTG